MRLYSSLSSVLVLSAALSAQNLVEYQAPTNFTSRGNIGTGTGEILQGFHSAQWHALGKAAAGNVGEINGFRGTFQDQDRATLEKYNWVVRRGTDAAGPTTGTPGEIFVSTPQSLTPVGTGKVFAVTVTLALRTPVKVPCDKFFAVGIRLQAAKWTADGQSCHMSRGDNTQGDDPSTKLVEMAWQIVGSATSATHPSLKRSWKMGFLQNAPALQLGNFRGTASSRFGTGGHFPIPGTHGLAFRVSAAGQTGDLALIFLSGKFGRCLPLFGGHWALDFGTLVTTPVVVGSIAGTGAAAKFEAKSFPLIPKTLKGDFAFQALLFNPKKSSLSLSNAVKMTL